MSSNIEDFLIRFKFMDKEAIQGFKRVSKSIDEIKKKSKKLKKTEEDTSQSRSRSNKDETRATKKTTAAINKQNQARRSGQVDLKRENSLLAQQNALRRKIAQAESLGMKPSGYKTTLATSKKPDHIQNRRLQLEEEILKVKEKAAIVDKKAAKGQTAAAKSSLSSARNRLSAGLSKTQAMGGGGNAPLIASAQKALKSEDINVVREYANKVAQLNRNLKTREQIEDRLASLTRNKNYQLLAASKNTRMAAHASNVYRKAEELLRQNTTSSIREYKRLVAGLNNTAAAYRRNQREAIKLRTVQNSLRDSTRNMIRGYASLFAVLQTTQHINRTGQDFEAMNSAMLAAMGTSEEAAKQIAFLDQMTSRLGMSIIDTADQYTKFVFAAKGKMSTEEVNILFNNMAELGTVLGISRERMKLSFNAIQQINGLPSGVIH